MILAEFRPHEGEAEMAYLWRVCEAKTSGLLDAEWQEVADYMNRTYKGSEEEYWSPNTYRRSYQYAKKFLDVLVHESEPATATNADELRLERIALQKERQLLRDERVQYNKYIREDSRFEHQLDELERHIMDMGARRYVPYTPVIHGQSEKEMLVLLSDWHIGMDFRSEFGVYNSDIAKRRLDALLDEIFEYQELFRCKAVNVAALGDMISGSIHQTVAISNRENVIEQTEMAAEMMADFIHMLCGKFETVTFVSVAGNHSRMTESKEKAVKNEKLDDLIGWHVKSALKHMPNFKAPMVVDNTVAELGICGQLYYFVHGDNDDVNQASIAKLAFMLGEIPYAVCMGHRHVFMGGCNGVKVVQSGSLCGAGDDYTVQRRMTGEPTQTILICDENGIKGYFPVNLDC